jgi:hypothetical protein
VDWSLDPEHLLADNPVKAIAATAATKSSLFMVVLLLFAERTRNLGIWLQRSGGGKLEFCPQSPLWRGFELEAALIKMSEISDDRQPEA